MRHRIVLLSIIIVILIATNVAYFLARPAASSQNNNAYIAELKSKARHGDRAAAYKLGDIYLTGQGAKPDLIESYYWVHYNGTYVGDDEFLRLATIIGKRDLYV